MKTSVVITLSLLASLACSDSTAPSPVGVWTLQTIGGQPLPQLADANTTINNDIIDIRADGTFQESSVRTVVGSSGQPQKAYAGGWTLTDDVVILTTTSGDAQGAYSATLRGTQLTRVFAGKDWIFEKQ